MKKYGLILLAIAVITLAVLEALPQKHVNPPVRQEPAWNQPATRALAKRACFDCHSNETRWPPYARHAPVSWLVARDVARGRAELNFSEWDRCQNEAREMAHAVISGEMPPKLYLVAHPDARLTSSERADLAGGLEQTLAAERTSRASSAIPRSAMH